MEEEKINYNDIPVVFCKHCLSLRVESLDGIDYCGDCGSSETGSTHISEWERMYEYRYGRNYLTGEEI